MRTIVYVDGFNLYYGCLNGTPHRWLDLDGLCRRLLREDSEIVAIKYFTARVQPRAGNPQQTQRQQIYLRALLTTPHLSVHLGHFITRAAMRRLVNPPRRGSKYAQVWTTEEKGSDVNLASHLRFAPVTTLPWLSRTTVISRNRFRSCGKISRRPSAF